MGLAFFTSYSLAFSNTGGSILHLKERVVFVLNWDIIISGAYIPTTANSFVHFCSSSQFIPDQLYFSNFLASPKTL